MILVSNELIPTHDQLLLQFVLPRLIIVLTFEFVDVVISKNGISIRMTSERWQHITVGHPEIADYYYEILDAINNPDTIYEGKNDAFIAVKNIDENVDKYLVVIYKESSKWDGFVITAYFSKKIQEFQKKQIIWKQQN